MFRSAPPHGGRHQCQRVILAVVAVSIRAPARGATCCLPQKTPGNCFDPRPRTGGDRECDRIGGARPVSIRAPARGATGDGLCGDPTGRVSIRAPARGATWSPWTGCQSVSVSIRAPARGATSCTGPGTGCPWFRSAPPHGGRLTRISKQPLISRFRSAPPHGGRHGADHAGCAAMVCFDPRPRTGGDRIISSPSFLTWGFDPRPRTGGDARPGRRHGNLLVSIRAPARGATAWIRWRKSWPTFRSAPPHGGRRVQSIQAAANYVFRSAPPHGGRPW